MRELIARAVCFVTMVLVIVLAHVFASRHNPPVVSLSPPPSRPVAPPAPLVMPSPPPTAQVTRGRAVYADQGCATCHAIAGEGNPRHPLDGVGARYGTAELRQLITGSGAASAQLPAAVLRRKQRYQSLPAEDLDALVNYLTTLMPKT